MVPTEIVLNNGKIRLFRCLRFTMFLPSWDHQLQLDAICRNGVHQICDAINISHLQKASNKYICMYVYIYNYI
jgi:hypothetical protein